MRSKPAVTAAIDSKSATMDLLKEMKGVKANPKALKPITDPFKVPQGSKPSLDHPKGEVKPNRKSRKGMEAPVTTYVRSLGGDYMTTQEIASALGVSPQLVRKWSKDPDIGAPSFVAPFGKLRVHLYTKEDLKELTEMMAKRRQVISTKPVVAPNRKAASGRSKDQSN